MGGYKTRQLNLAAFLYASKLQLVSTVQIDGDFFFIFAPKEKAEQLVQDYFADTATVNPRELFSRLNALRDLIFSGGSKV